MKFSQTSLILSCVFMLGGLVLQTLASHLPDTVFGNTAHRDMLRLAANILMFNALGIGMLSIILSGKFIAFYEKVLKAACLVLIIGTLSFVGSIICISLGLIERTPTAPIGGTLQMIGWLLAAVAFIKKS